MEMPDFPPADGPDPRTIMEQEVEDHLRQVDIVMRAMAAEFKYLVEHEDVIPYAAAVMIGTRWKAS